MNEEILELKKKKKEELDAYMKDKQRKKSAYSISSKN